MRRADAKRFVTRADNIELTETSLSFPPWRSGVSGRLWARAFRIVERPRSTESFEQLGIAVKLEIACRKHRKLTSALEIAHVLFIDIVGYSIRPTDEQQAPVDRLNQVVRSSDEFNRAAAAGRLKKIPTGDGMALIFHDSPEQPVECAVEISRVLKHHPDLPVRMGVHSGPVSEVTDVNGRVNAAGVGINVAQRLMDCGDAGHILLSKRVAEDLQQNGRWRPHLLDLGEVEVKHGDRVHVFNFHTGDAGNSEPPAKFIQAKQHDRRAWDQSRANPRPEQAAFPSASCHSRTLAATPSRNISVTESAKISSLT